MADNIKLSKANPYQLLTGSVYVGGKSSFEGNYIAFKTRIYRTNQDGEGRATPGILFVPMTEDARVQKLFTLWCNHHEVKAYAYLWHGLGSERHIVIDSSKDNAIRRYSFVGFEDDILPFKEGEYTIVTVQRTTQPACYLGNVAAYKQPRSQRSAMFARGAVLPKTFEVGGKNVTLADKCTTYVVSLVETRTADDDEVKAAKKVLAAFAAAPVGTFARIDDFAN